MNIPFEYPWLLLLIPLAWFAIWRLVHQKGAIGFSSTTLLDGVGIRIPLILIERLSLSVFVTVIILMLARPIELIRNTVPVYQEARDIVITFDISGSMQGSKLEAAKNVTKEFVSGQPQDRIALVTFDNKAFLEWPLSADHDSLIYRIDQILSGNGTTISAGLIFGLEHLQRYGQNHGAIIVISDGVSKIEPEEKTAIKEVLGETQIYWILIGTEANPLTREFENYINSLGGKTYRGETKEMAGIFAEIAALEAGPVLWEQRVSAVHDVGVLPWVALISLVGVWIVHRVREV